MLYNRVMNATECKVRGCGGGGRLAKGMCMACYVWVSKNPGRDPATRKRVNKGGGRTVGACSVDGCDVSGPLFDTRCNACYQWLVLNPDGDPSLRRRVPSRAAQGEGMTSAERARKRRSNQQGLIVETVRSSVVVDKHGRWCYLCESPIGTDEPMEIDHVHPTSKGGPHMYVNVRPTHRHCNRSKADQMLDELDLPFVPPHLKVVS